MRVRGLAADGCAAGRGVCACACLANTTKTRLPRLVGGTKA